jgi:hypothetical protein
MTKNKEMEKWLIDLGYIHGADFGTWTDCNGGLIDDDIVNKFWQERQKTVEIIRIESRIGEINNLKILGFMQIKHTKKPDFIDYKIMLEKQLNQLTAN